MQIRGWMIVAALGAASVARAKPAEPCKGLTPEACDQAAFGFDHGITLDGKKVARDEKRAAAMYQAVCEAKLATGCSELASMGHRAGLDDAGVIRWLRAACALDPDQGCWDLGLELKESDARADRDEARAIFDQRCTAKHGDACYALADMSNRPASIGWYQKACGFGDERGCLELARIYFADQDPSMDAAASTRALEALCDGGLVNACSFASDRHFAGKGARASRADADVWMKKACALGDDASCRSLERRR